MASDPGITPIRRITRPLVQKKRYGWSVTWPIHDLAAPVEAYAYKEFPAWADAYRYARQIA